MQAKLSGPTLNQADVGDDPSPAIEKNLEAAIASATLEQMCAMDIQPDAPTAVNLNCASHLLMKIDVDADFQHVGISPHTDYIRDRLVERFAMLEGGQLEVTS